MEEELWGEKKTAQDLRANGVTTLILRFIYSMCHNQPQKVWSCQV